MGEQMIMLGAGGHAVSVLSAALLAGFDVTALYDDDPARIGQEMYGVPIVGTLQDAPGTGLAFIAIGDNETRKAIAERSDYSYATIIHPHVIMGHEGKVGVGTSVLGGSILQPRTVIGDHAILSAGVSISHETRIGNYSLVGSCVAFGGAITVGDLVLVGTGSTLLPGITIGDGATVGAGAVVLHDVAPGTTVVGNPAKTIRT